MKIKLRRADNNDEIEFNYNLSVEECREQIESFCDGTNCHLVYYELQYKTASEQPIIAMCRHNFEKKSEELFYTSPSESGKILNEYWKCSKCNLIKQSNLESKTNITMYRLYIIHEDIRTHGGKMYIKDNNSNTWFPWKAMQFRTIEAANSKAHELNLSEYYIEDECGETVYPMKPGKL